MAQQVAEEHRRDLTCERPPDPEPDGTAGESTSWWTRRRAETTACPIGPARSNDRVPRRAIAPSVGALLIRMGTRLGGTSMRTS